MLTAGLVSAVLGMQLPGPGSIYLGQELKFMAPVKIGDTIKAEVEIIEKFEEKNRIKLSTICTNQNGVEVLIGVATIMPPK
jgi:3-hydroxybutyryl-CoA dehydratase